VVKAPFTQLWSIHAFVRADEQIKQLPLAFVLMSGKRRIDYRYVLRALKGELERQSPSDGRPPWEVREIVADFEMAQWQAFKDEFAGIIVRGCGFHWGQAVWRKMQALGLQHAYNNDTAMHHYCRQLLALPILPWEIIESTMDELASEATTDSQRQLCHYIRQTWIQSSVWTPANWSTFYRMVRTNNDVEGWHRRQH